MRIALTGVLVGFVAVTLLSQNESRALVSTRGQINPAGVNGAVKGSGTPNRISKWVDEKELGDSELFETHGNVGIGTTTPDSKLTVAGRIDASVTGISAALRGNSPEGSGVLGISDSGSGVLGTSNTNIGVHGVSTTFIGVRGFSDGGTGVHGSSTSGTGVFGRSTTGLAGEFLGDVSVSGTLSKAGGSFKIDHPLDPENKYLYHSFVESPDMKNIYDGNVVTDENGEAVVILPEYFEALNRDFRYQLTVIGSFSQAIVAQKIKQNRFTIKTSSPGVEVSWQVTGIRQDPWANKNRIKIEVEKEERERGFFLHPEVYDQPYERSVEWVRRAGLSTRQRKLMRR